jgi:hypothetical protein
MSCKLNRGLNLNRTVLPFFPLQRSALIDLTTDRLSFFHSSTTSYSETTPPAKRKLLSKGEKEQLSKQLANNQDMKEIILGVLLGDGCIALHGKGARLQFMQKDREFIEDLYSKFELVGIVGGGPKPWSYTHKLSGNTHSAYQLKTFTLPFFLDLHTEWYKQVNGKFIKILPYNIGEWLTPKALAYFIACDGTYNKLRGCIHLCTDSFTLDEVNLLRSVLLERFGIESTINLANRVQYRIRIPKDQVLKLQALIKNIIPLSMAYRIGILSLE